MHMLMDDVLILQNRLNQTVLWWMGLFQRIESSKVTQMHGDIQKGFIRAEVTPATTLLDHASYNAAKEAGAVRTEGKDAVLQDKDVVLIKWK